MEEINPPKANETSHSLEPSAAILNSIFEKGLIVEGRRFAKLVGFVPSVPNVSVVVFKERIYEKVPSSSVGAAMPQLFVTPRYLLLF